MEYHCIDHLKMIHTMNTNLQFFAYSQNRRETHSAAVRFAIPARKQSKDPLQAISFTPVVTE